MFREQYKGAFDEIKADRSQIDKIFELAEKKPEKKAKIIPFRQVGTLAAAVAIVLVVSLYPNFSDFIKTDENTIEPKGIVQPQVVNVLDDTAISGAAPTNGGEVVSEQKEKATGNKTVANKKTESKVTETKENVEKSDADKTVTAKAEDKSSNVRYVISNQTESKKTNEISVVSTQIGTDKTDNTSSASAAEENIAPSATNDTIKVAEVQSVEAASGASVEVAQDAAAPAVANEYAEQESSKVMRASGGGSSAAASSLIFAEFPDFGEDKSAAVYAYRENAGIAERIEANAADMGGYKYVVVANEAECRIAYAEKDGVLYQFTATNLTDEEFEKLIGSYL